MRPWTSVPCREAVKSLRHFWTLDFLFFFHIGFDQLIFFSPFFSSVLINKQLYLSIPFLDIANRHISENR